LETTPFVGTAVVVDGEDTLRVTLVWGEVPIFPTVIPALLPAIRPKNSVHCSAFGSNQSLNGHIGSAFRGLSGELPRHMTALGITFNGGRSAKTVPETKQDQKNLFIDT
jgi:hypothetical protein